GRSFYEQCLPSNSLSIGYSPSTLHWISCKPCNVSNHCVSLYALNDENDKFKEQARLDYTKFLEHHSNELLPGGVLILCIGCTNDNGFHGGIEITFQLLYKCAKLLPITEEELLDFTFPVYYQNYKELIDYDLFKKFSLKLIKFELCEIRIDMLTRFQQGELTLDEFAKHCTQFVRSWSEPLLQEILEKNNHRSKEAVKILLEQFWNIYEQEVKELANQFNIHGFITFLILKKDLL
ncbi:unnamed protein product, partial [Rotaria sordida]